MSKRTLSVLAYYGAAFAVPVVVGGAMMSWLPKAWLAGPIPLVIYLLAAACTLPLAGRAWHLTDEAAREAHKSAMFWGGSFGALAGLVALMIWISFATDPKERAADIIGLWSGMVPQQPLTLVMLGAVCVLLVQLAGYAIAWAMWWLRASPSASQSISHKP